MRSVDVNNLGELDIRFCDSYESGLLGLLPLPGTLYDFFRILQCPIVRGGGGYLATVSATLIRHFGAMRLPLVAKYDVFEEVRHVRLRTHA